MGNRNITWDDGGTIIKQGTMGYRNETGDGGYRNKTGDDGVPE